MVTPCRISPPGSLHMITRRTSQGQMTLRPDPEINQCLQYCLAYAAQRNEMDVHAGSVLSNHGHLGVTDRLGDHLPGFNRDFFSLTARSINCYRGRSESFWRPFRPNCVLVAPFAEDVIDKFAYIIVNPVEAELVSHVRKWPGVIIHPGEQEVLEVERPSFFFDELGDLPEKILIPITVPEVLDADTEQLRRRLKDEVQRREQAIRERVRSSGRAFMGAKRVLKQSTSSSPNRPPELGEREPTIACKNKDLRTAMLDWKRARQKRYDELRQELAAQVRKVGNTVFPEGTFAIWRWYGFEREPWEGCLWKRLIAGMT